MYPYVIKNYVAQISNLIRLNSKYLDFSHYNIIGYHSIRSKETEIISIGLGKSQLYIPRKNNNINDWFKKNEGIYKSEKRVKR